MAMARRESPLTQMEIQGQVSPEGSRTHYLPKFPYWPQYSRGSPLLPTPYAFSPH